MSIDLVRRETNVLFYMAGYIDQFCSLEDADVDTLKVQMLGAVDVLVTKCYSEAICTNRWTLLGYLICYFDSMGNLSSKGSPFPFLKYVLENESQWKAEAIRIEEQRMAARQHCPITAKFKSSWPLYLDFPSREVSDAIMSKLTTIINNRVSENEQPVQNDTAVISSGEMTTLKTFSCLESAVLAYFEEMDK